MFDLIDLVWLLATEPIRWLFKPVTRHRDRRAEIQNSAMARYYRTTWPWGR